MATTDTDPMPPDLAAAVIDEARAILSGAPWPAGQEQCLRGPHVTVVVSACESDDDEAIDVPITIHARGPSPLGGLPIGLTVDGGNVTRAARLDKLGQHVFRGLPDHGQYQLSLGSRRGARVLRWEPDVDITCDRAIVPAAGPASFERRFVCADGRVVCDVILDDQRVLLAEIRATGDLVDRFVSLSWTIVRPTVEQRRVNRLVLPLRPTGDLEWGGWVRLSQGADRPWLPEDQVELELSSTPWPLSELATVPPEVVARSIGAGGGGTLDAWRAIYPRLPVDLPAGVRQAIQRSLR
jgi:hypothetical protein